MYMQNGIWWLKVVFLTVELPCKGHQALPMTRRESGTGGYQTICSGGYLEA